MARRLATARADVVGPGNTAARDRDREQPAGATDVDGDRSQDGRYSGLGAPGTRRRISQTAVKRADMGQRPAFNVELGSAALCLALDCNPVFVGLLGRPYP